MTCWHGFSENEAAAAYAYGDPRTAASRKPQRVMKPRLVLTDPADLEATVNLAVLYWRAAGRRRSTTNCCRKES